MPAITGPARYFFLRTPRGAHEDIPGWPPAIHASLDGPDNRMAVAVRMYPEADGLRVEPITTEAEIGADAGGAFVLTRETTMGLTDRRANVEMKLLGVRALTKDGKGPDYALHFVVRVYGGGGNTPRRPVIVPTDALVIERYVEVGDRAEAQLMLRLTGTQLADAPAYVEDAAIERLARHALDRAIPGMQARHAITSETMAGRVSLYGKADSTALGDNARAELLRTSGVVEVSDFVVYSENLKGQVEQALAGKGLGFLRVLVEHDLVSLHGVVPDTATMHRAREVVLRIPGVRGVVTNQVEVQATGASAE